MIIWSSVPWSDSLYLHTSHVGWSRQLINSQNNVFWLQCGKQHCLRACVGSRSSCSLGQNVVRTTHLFFKWFRHGVKKDRCFPDLASCTSKQSALNIPGRYSSLQVRWDLRLIRHMVSQCLTSKKIDRYRFVVRKSAVHIRSSQDPNYLLLARWLRFFRVDPIR